jgi:hypothetical protein
LAKEPVKLGALAQLKLIKHGRSWDGMQRCWVREDSRAWAAFLGSSRALG